MNAQELIKIINGGKYTLAEKDRLYDEFIKNSKDQTERKLVQEAYESYYRDGEAWCDLESSMQYEDLESGPIGAYRGSDDDF